MKFILVDQLIRIEHAKSIVMAKNVSMAEEYLADHFPGFPVLPGVLMLEAAIQAAAWLVRTTLEFAPSMIVLQEVRGVRYGTFVAPGQTLTITADTLEISEKTSSFKVKGTMNGNNAIQAKLQLAHLNLADTDPAMAPADAAMRAAQKERWQLLSQTQTA